jgi:hypothetical protein
MNNQNQTTGTSKRRVYLQQEMFLFGLPELESMGIKVVLDDCNRILSYTVDNPDIEVVCGTYRTY